MRKLGGFIVSLIDNKAGTISIPEIQSIGVEGTREKKKEPHPRTSKLEIQPREGVRKLNLQEIGY
jgi:hypothetical protein